MGSAREIEGLGAEDMRANEARPLPADEETPGAQRPESNGDYPRVASWPASPGFTRSRSSFD
ncbi:MAG TPA: hypothetical protein VN753_05920, partial [Terracidiphilus sp.]|nr:hypothetical protein [Terracidiphilus sp.]